MHRSCCLLLLFTFAGLAKDPTEWKSGKLLDLSSGTETRVAGVNGVVSTRLRKIFTYRVDAGERVYEAQEVGRRVPRVEVNAPIPYSVSKDYLFVKDGDGKVHKLALMKTTRKE